MKIVQINTFSYKSTGTIMMNIHNFLINQGEDSYVVWGRGRKSENKNEIFIGNKFSIYFHALYTRLTDKTGFASIISTFKLIQKLKIINPDIVQIHNIHGYYINIKLLFNYLKKSKKKVIWTLHDCWAFTGHCTHFEDIGCSKWKTYCYKCPQIDSYPKSIIDNSLKNFKVKKELFNGLDLEIISPSHWLEKLVKQSFLKKYHVNVIENGIDTNIFKVRKSLFKQKYNIEDKRIILGVASTWNYKKGLHDFIKLSNFIENDEIIILVGLNRKQIKKLPSNIIGIKRTNNPIELAEIYTAADIFFNPTYEDNYPTVNLESVACGTPVVTYPTGGSPESAIQGTIVNNIFEFLNVRKKIYNLKLNLVSSSIISQESMLQKYYKLYKKTLDERL